MATTTDSWQTSDSDGTDSAALTPGRLVQLRDNFRADRAYRASQNAVCKNPITDVALNREIVTSADFSFSHVLDDWTATNQQRSGRCWMFAGLNLLRVGAMEKMNLKKFEFSQNYTFFWDKFERSNYFLERIIDTAGRDLDDRHVAFLLERPLDDGGQWSMFVNIIEKHGLVPLAAMPETDSSSNSARMNEVLLHKLREGGRTLRGAAAEGADGGRLRVLKHEILEVVYRILSIHLGTPPDSFLWQWNDKDKKFHRDGQLTPREFAKRYVTVPIDEYVCLVHDPRPDNPPNRTYTVQYLGNVEGGSIVTYLNVDIALIKQVAMNTIQQGEPVWFGCDVAPMMDRKLGLWDEKLFDFETVYDTRFTLDKPERLHYRQTLMTHAMLFTGVDVVDENAHQVARRWRVENSWGEDAGRDGFFLMNDNWFEQFVFEIAAHRRHLPDSLQAAIAEEPIALPPWDPMGSLARGA